MEIIIHARHATLAEDFREIATEKLQALNRFSVLIESIKVEVLLEENPRHGKHAHQVTLTTHGAGPFLRAQGSSFNDLAAFDDAVKSFELQIRKAHEKSKDVGHDSLRNRA